MLIIGAAISLFCPVGTNCERSGNLIHLPFNMPTPDLDTYIAASDPTNSQSTLTHTLPLVSKQFYRLTKEHDIFWENALLRLTKRCEMWEDCLKRFVFDSRCDKIRADIVERNRNRNRRDKRTKSNQLQQQRSQQQGGELPQSADALIQTVANMGVNNHNNPPQSSDNSIATTKDVALLKQASEALQSHPPRNHAATSSGMYQCIYKSIVHDHLRYQGKVFYMPSAVRLGTPYGLHFFEPRYRLLVSEVMAPYPVAARRGEQISPMIPSLYPNNNLRKNGDDDDIKSELLNLLEQNQALMGRFHVPTFIHAHQSPLRRNTPATIVQIRQCMVSRDGSADVFLHPIAYIWIDEVWERPGTGGLFEARGIRMGKEVSESYEYYQRW